MTDSCPDDTIHSGGNAPQSRKQALRQTIQIAALEQGRIRNLHGGLAVGFLEISLLEIDRDTELCIREGAGQKFARISRVFGGVVVLPYQVVVFGFDRSHCKLSDDRGQKLNSRRCPFEGDRVWSLESRKARKPDKGGTTAILRRLLAVTLL